MERIPYHQVASAIADADDAEARAAASDLVSSYYAIEPPLETVRERMTLLKETLRAALARQGK